MRYAVTHLPARMEPDREQWASYWRQRAAEAGYAPAGQPSARVVQEHPAWVEGERAVSMLVVEGEVVPCPNGASPGVDEYDQQALRAALAAGMPVGMDAADPMEELEGAYGALVTHTWETRRAATKQVPACIDATREEAVMTWGVAVHGDRWVAGDTELHIWSKLLPGLDIGAWRRWCLRGMP